MTESTGLQQVESPVRIDVHLWVDRRKLEYAKALLSHALPTGDLDRLFDRALDAVIRQQERRKFALTAKPRKAAARGASQSARRVPAEVRREVWRRDGGQCTFVSGNGRRCGERSRLEFDHLVPVARGGLSTVDNVRLRCRAHNQYEAERIFGTEFMEGKRREARSALDQDTRAVISGLRNLGCRADEARAAAGAATGTTLEEKLRSALQALRPPRATQRAQIHRPDPGGARPCQQPSEEELALSP